MNKSNETSSPDDNEGVKISFLPASDELHDFREDDADALLLLLRIAHLDFISVKKQLSVAELYNLAILCDKYDCVHLVKPWVDEWSLWVAHGARHQVGGELLSKRLFIAWSFGRIEDFRASASVLLMQSGTDKNGQLLDLEGEVIPEVMPPGVIGQYIICLTLAKVFANLELSRGDHITSPECNRKTTSNPKVPNKALHGQQDN